MTSALTAGPWDEYQARHPAPYDDAEWERWQAQGPKLATSAARALAPMSSGEIRLLRLMTTLSTDRCQQGWHLDDLSFDERGQAVVKDWTLVVLRQLPQTADWPVRHHSCRRRLPDLASAGVR